MKKLIAIILSAVLLLILPTACGSDPVSATVVSSAKGSQGSPRVCNVVIRAEADGGSLADALKELNDAGELTYDGYDSDYGFFITSLIGVEADASANEFFAVYTTLGEYDGVAYSNAEYGTYFYNGKTLSSASYGVSGLPMVVGELYVIVLESY